MPFSRF